MQQRKQIVTNANTQIINEIVLMIFITPHHQGRAMPNTEIK
jgi:hypothetical protein